MLPNYTNDTNAYYDSPSLGITNENHHVAMFSDDFQTFLMFHPIDNPLTPPNITVPLRVINWSWTGAGDTNSSGGWYMPSGRAGAVDDNEPTTAFPVWTNVINGYTFQGFKIYTNSDCQ